VLARAGFDGRVTGSPAQVGLLPRSRRATAIPGYRARRAAAVKRLA